MSAAILPFERQRPRGEPAAEPGSGPAAEELAARALQGDREAWAALIARHGRQVLVSLLARGVPMAQARELAHEAWVRLTEQQRLGRLAGLILPGLAIAQAHLLLLESRRQAATSAQKRAPELALDGLSQDFPDDAPDALSQALGKEELRRTLAALERCTPAEQRVFAALYGRAPARSHAEAAQRLGLSVQRVRQVLFEVRGKLRALLEGDAP